MLGCANKLHWNVNEMFLIELSIEIDVTRKKALKRLLRKFRIYYRRDKDEDDEESISHRTMLRR